MGVVKVVKPFQPDPTDESGRFGRVWVEALQALTSPVSLSQIRSEMTLREMRLIRQPRLSVMPVTDSEWSKILSMSQEISGSGV